MVSEGVEERTIQGYANISSSIRSTIMFDLSKSLFSKIKSKNKKNLLFLIHTLIF